MKPAPLNDVFKKAVVLSRSIGAPTPDELFKSVNYTVSKSRINSWQRRRDHKNFGHIDNESLIVYMNALIEWARKYEWIDDSDDGENERQTQHR